MDRVGLRPKLLGADEQELIHTRTHAKALVVPSLALISVGAVVGAGAAAIPTVARPIGQLAVVAAGLALVVWWVLIPFLRWRSTTYTITNRRLIARRGIVNRVGLDLLLNRVAEISYQRSLTDRMLGCGTLIVQTAADDGRIVLVDVPEVDHVHGQLTELLFGEPAPLPRPVRR